MSSNPGPEGARWNVPDWDPNEGSSQTTYLDRIASLEVELDAAHKEIVSLKLQLSGVNDNKANHTDSSISSTPSPRHKVIVRENAETFRLKWSELHLFARIEKLDIEKLVKADPVPALIKAAFLYLNQQQVDEISGSGHTFLNLDQIDDWYRSGGTLGIELDEWLKFEEAGIVSLKKLSIKTLYLLSHIQKFKDEASRRDIEQRAKAEISSKDISRRKRIKVLREKSFRGAKVLAIGAVIPLVWFGAQYLYKYFPFSKIWNWLFI